jgi:hypothetical protein
MQTLIETPGAKKQTEQTDVTAGNKLSRVAKAFAGLPFDVQEAARAVKKGSGGPEKTEAPSSSRVVASAGRGEEAVENDRAGSAAGLFTRRLTFLLRDNPDMTYDEVLDVMVDTDFSKDGNTQRPTETRTGKGDAKDAKRRFGCIITNGDHEGTDKDLNANRDGDAMYAALSSRGFEFDTFGIHTDQKRDEMLSIIGPLNAATWLGPGDVLAFHFSGHGSDTSILGTDLKGLSGTHFHTLASLAKTQGFQLRVTIDACFSGDLVASVRDRRRLAERKGATKPDRKAALSEVSNLMVYTLQLGMKCHQSTEAQLLAKYNASRRGQVMPLEKLSDELVDDQMNSVPEYVTTWWAEEGWAQVFSLMDPLDQLSAGPFWIPEPGAELTYSALQDMLDETYEKVMNALE